MKYLFIGEKRSEKAKQMNVRWEDGRLAAKQLFDALNHCGISKYDCSFMNLFEPLKQQGILGKLKETHYSWIVTCQSSGLIIVAMGNRVSKKLTEMKIEHLKITHPAAKGLIRRKENYCNHVKQILIIQ